MVVAHPRVRDRSPSRATMRPTHSHGPTRADPVRVCMRIRTSSMGPLTIPVANPPHAPQAATTVNGSLEHSSVGSGERCSRARA